MRLFGLFNFLKPAKKPEIEPEQPPKVHTVVINGKTLNSHEIFCAECDSRMHLRTSKYGLFYGCSKFPKCRGTHGAHPDGAPLGIPADPETKKYRHKAHRKFDQLWIKGWMTRPQAYVWMQKELNMTEAEAHIGRFNIDQCNELMTVVARYLKSIKGNGKVHKERAKNGRRAKADARKRKQRMQEITMDEQIAEFNMVHN